MRPTLFGARAIAFYAVCVLAYFATPYANLFFLLLGFLSVQWVLAALWSASSLRGVEVRTTPVVVEVPAGHRVQLDVQVAAARPRFDIGVELVAATPDGESISLGGGEGCLGIGLTPVRVSAPSERRGVFTATIVQVTSTYPFGLFRRARSVPVSAEVIVHPAPSPEFEDATRAQDVMAELSGISATAESGTQPAALRDHRQGESLKTVHWRASARRSKLVALDWEADRAEGLEVVLDRRAGVRAFEEALSDLVAIAGLARASKESLLLRTQGLDRAFGEGHAAWRDLLRFVAETTRLHAADVAPPSASPGVLRLPRAGGQGAGPLPAHAPELAEVPSV